MQPLMQQPPTPEWIVDTVAALFGTGVALGDAGAGPDGEVASFRWQYTWHFQYAPADPAAGKGIRTALAALKSDVAAMTAPRPGSPWMTSYRAAAGPADRRRSCETDRFSVEVVVRLACGKRAAELSLEK